MSKDKDEPKKITDDFLASTKSDPLAIFRALPGYTISPKRDPYSGPRLIGH